MYSPLRLDTHSATLSSSLGDAPAVRLGRPNSFVTKVCPQRPFAPYPLPPSPYRPESAVLAAAPHKPLSRMEDFASGAHSHDVTQLGSFMAQT